MLNDILHQFTSLGFPRPERWRCTHDVLLLYDVQYKVHDIHSWHRLGSYWFIIYLLINHFTFRTECLSSRPDTIAGTVEYKDSVKISAGTARKTPRQ